MDLELIAILLLTVVAPLWIIFHYVTMWKKNKGLTAEDEAALADLRAASEKLEQRLATMERILDDEVPDWRQRRETL